MPESISATPTPWPVTLRPAASFFAHTAGAPIMLFASFRVVSAESTSQGFFAGGAGGVGVVVVVVAACAGATPASPAAAPPETASAADSTPAGHFLPRIGRRGDFV